MSTFAHPKLPVVLRSIVHKMWNQLWITYVNLWKRGVVVWKMGGFRGYEIEFYCLRPIDSVKFPCYTRGIPIPERSGLTP